MYQRKRNLLTLLFSLLFTLPSIASGIFNIKDFGAMADSAGNNADAIQKAIDACSASGGGTVLVPAGGVFIAGPFQLKSYVNLFIENGAKLLASGDEKHYTISAFKENRGEGMMWIYAENAVQLSISGSGIIDGNGISFMGAELEDSYVLKPVTKEDPRPHLLTLIGCSNVRINSVTFRNSAYWTIHLAGCNDAVFDNITLLNSVKIRNSDGIDIDHSKNVRISNCYIESGDDCICLKNRREYEAYGSCENIVVTNCTMTSSSCAIKIGSENMDSISHIVISNCIIRNSNRGLGIQHRDEGTVYDVSFSNITLDCHLFSDVWWGKSEPIYITAYRRATANNKDAGWRLPKSETHGKVGTVKNIYFSNIKCTGESGVYVSAESADKISDIYFNEVDITLNRTTSINGGIYDRRPCEAEGLIKSDIAAFHFDNATNITVNNCSVRWGNNKAPYYSNALKSKGVKNLKTINFQATAAIEGMEAVKSE